jgi:hypothetical protein
MRSLAAALFLLLAWALLLPSVFAQKRQKQKKEPPAFPAQILTAKTVYLDCDCRHEMVSSVPTALPEVLDWGRFEIATNRNDADLILLFTMNPYLGDYFTRDGPDKRQPGVDFTILTVIDGHTGRGLWTDNRRWGYGFVGPASRDLIRDLRVAVAAQIKRWTFEQVLQCSVTPVYADFAHLTAEQALAKAGGGEFEVSQIPDAPDRLALSSRSAPEFCKTAQLLIDADHGIFGFDVLPAAADTLDVDDILQHSAEFDFTGGQEVGSDRTYFAAERRDKKLLIKYYMENRRPVLTEVRFLY